MLMTMTSHEVEVAVVLGPGAVVGTAWMAGLAQGLRLEGVDLADAGLIVGTSAGAIVGALLTTRTDLASVAQVRERAGVNPQKQLDAVFAVLGDPSLEPAEARRRVARMASAMTADRHLESMIALTGDVPWPDQRDLRIPTINAETGEPRIWTGADGARLASVVAASSAMPGVVEPVVINGVGHMDGALRAGANADLAAHAKAVVLIEPLFHLFGGEPDASAEHLVPDEESRAAFGPDLNDTRSWSAAYAAGLRQGRSQPQRVARAFAPAASQPSARIN
jgi:NTE family protein